MTFRVAGCQVGSAKVAKSQVINPIGQCGEDEIAILNAAHRVIPTIDFFFGGIISLVEVDFAIANEGVEAVVAGSRGA